MPDALTYVVLAGGRGERLRPLTDLVPKPLLPMRTGARVIDFTLANCLASPAGDCLVVAQYRADMIAEHVATRWRRPFKARGRRISTLRFDRKAPGAPEGTAVALLETLGQMDAPSEDLVVLGGDHVYSMDYGEMVAAHRRSGAAATVAVVPRSPCDSRRFGIVLDGPGGIVEAYSEKPPTLDGLTRPGSPPLASMGIYAFSTRKLRPLLERDMDRMPQDIGHDLIPALAQSGELRAFRFVQPDGSPRFWEDIGELDAYDRCR